MGTTNRPVWARINSSWMRLSLEVRRRFCRIAAEAGGMNGNRTSAAPAGVPKTKQKKMSAKDAIEAEINLTKSETLVRYPSKGAKNSG